MEDFLPFLEVEGLMSAFSRGSVQIVLHVDFFFFDVFVEGECHIFSAILIPQF